MSKEESAFTAPKVFAKIAAVQGELAKQGISKDSENSFDRYKFRGIDAVYNALAPLLAKHGLIIMPRIVERDCQERLSRKGEPMFYVTVAAEFDFIAAEDGSIHVVRTYGEAMDRSDKATNKAMSAAYKYAAFMTFAIPTEGDNDADSETPDPAPRRQQQRSAPKPADEGMPDKEYNTLIATAKTAGVSEAGLMKKYGVDNLRMLSGKQYTQAIDGLSAMIAEKAREASNAQGGEFGEFDAKGFDQ